MLFNNKYTNKSINIEAHKKPTWNEYAKQIFWRDDRFQYILLVIKNDCISPQYNSEDAVSSRWK